MSEEFEKIVLKKLDVLDSLENKIDTLDRNLNGRMDELDKNLNGRMDEQNKNLNARMDELEKTMKEMNKTINERIDNVDKEIGFFFFFVFTVNIKVVYVCSIVNKQQKDINLINKKIDILNANLARHEEESSKQIGALFDLFEMNKDFNKFQSKRNAIVEAEIFNHDIRITKLEQKLSS